MKRDALYLLAFSKGAEVKFLLKGISKASDAQYIEDACNTLLRLGVRDHFVDWIAYENDIQEINFSPSVDDKLIEKMDKPTLYLYGFLRGAKLDISTNSLWFAAEKFGKKRRKDGTSQLSHSVISCRFMINFGIRDDELLALIILHDVCEDCGVSIGEIAEKFGKKMARMVSNLTKEKSGADPFEKINDPKEVVAKAAERWHNVCTMALSFNPKDLERKIIETREKCFPLMKEVWRTHPEYADVLMTLRDNMEMSLKICEMIIADWKMIGEFEK